MNQLPPALSPTATDPDLDAKTRAGRGLLTALDRCLSSRKIYALDHPARQEALAEMISRFSAFFDLYGYLRLDITATELQLEGRALITCDRRETAIPFRLFKDGIRELRFQRGVTRDELLAFISVLEIDARQLADLEHDTVSLLWSKDFQGIDYVALDEFDVLEEGGDDDRERNPELGSEVAAGIARVLGSITARGSGSGGGRGPSIGADAGPATGKGDGPGMGAHGGAGSGRKGGTGRHATGAIWTADTAPLLRERPTVIIARGVADEQACEVADAELDAVFTARPAISDLRELVESETLGTSIRRTLDLLIQFFPQAGRANATEVGPLLRGVAAFYAKKGDFAGVGHFLTRLRDSSFLDRVSGGGTLWLQLLDDVHAPDIRKQLLTYLNGPFLDDPVGLRRYLDPAGPALVRDVCDLYCRVASQKTRHVLRNYLVDNSRTNPEAFRLLLSRAGKLLGEVLEVIRDARPASIQLDRDLDWGTLSPPVKCQVLSIGTSLEGMARVRVLRLGLSEPDIFVRGAALRHMAECRAPELGATLSQWIEDGSFADRASEEKILALRALARCGGAFVLRLLKEKIRTRTWIFDRVKTNETRRAAVLALREIPGRETADLLETLAQDGDDVIRHAAEEVMRR